MKASTAVALSEVAVNLAYVAAAVALVALLFPGFRWWLRGQVRQAVYEFQMTAWRAENAPVVRFMNQLGEEQLPTEAEWPRSEA